MIGEESVSSENAHDSHGSISPEAAGRETVITASDAAIASQNQGAVTDAESDNDRNRATITNGSLANPEVGQLFAGQYDLLECLGQGGMGIVYKARDVALNRIVAIKLLRARPGLTDTETLRFQQEARAIANLDHKNIIRLFGIATASDGAPYFVMEFLEGRSLSDELRLQKRFSEERAIALTRQACDAIEHAHGKGVIHRDIKPSNLMLVYDKASGQEILKLVDFGIAKLHTEEGETIQQLTQTGELFGSPFYMSPEQCAGKRVSEKTDIYSLGCVLYEMLCGAPPFRGANAVETLILHQKGEASPVWKERRDLKSAEALDAILLKMLAKSGADRPSAKETRQELESALQLERGKLPRWLARFKSTLRRRTAKTIIVRATIISAAVLAIALPLFSWSVAARISQLPPSQITPDILWNSWDSYDQAGQTLFSAGEYKGAEEAYKKALFKANIDLGADRLYRRQTSLKELVYLYHTTNEQTRMKDAMSRLVDYTQLDDKPLVAAMSQLASADEKLKKNASPENVEAYVSAAMQEGFIGSIRSEEAKSAELMRIVSNRINEIPGVSADLLDKVQLSLLYFSRTSSTSYVPTSLRSSVLKRAVDKSSELKDNISRIMLADLLLSESPSNAQIAGNFIVNVLDNGTPYERAEASLLMGCIHWLDKNYALADSDIQNAISIYSRQLPRRYGRLAFALYRRGMYQENRMLFQQAIATLKRAETIAAYAAPTQSRFLGAAKRLEALAYMESGKFNEADSILRTLCHSASRNDIDGLDQAANLAERGYLHIKMNQYDKARQFLLDAVEIFRKQPHLSPAAADSYARAMSNLREIALMQGIGKEVEFWGAEVKKLKGVERIVDR